MDPDSQVSAFAPLNGSVSTMIMLIAAAVPAETPTPMSTSLFCGKPPRAARPNTTAAAASAPSPAAPAMPQPDASGAVVTNSTAPSPAPPETPRIAGSASGLRVTACTSTPASASAAPASTAASTRGTRVSST